MKTSTQIVLKSLLSQCSPDEQTALARHLASSTAEALEALASCSGNPLTDETSEETILKTVHPSWLSPYIRSLPEKEIAFFLAALGPQSAFLRKELLYTGDLPALTSLAKLFLQKTLLSSLSSDIEDLLPPSFLPESPLNPLLSLSEELSALSLKFLGLHDLAIEVRQIIEKGKLKQIYDVLHPAELNYFKILIQSSEPVTFAPMQLAHWSGDSEKLKGLIVQRGANRLGKALYGQDPSLIWYFLHKLPMEEAHLIQKLCSPLENKRATHALIGQILEFINYVRHNHG
jgi:hypothetical protein